jgi:hypothetical protein
MSHKTQVAGMRAEVQNILGNIQVIYQIPSTFVFGKLSAKVQLQVVTMYGISI